MRILAAIALLVTPCLWSQDKEIPKLAPYYPTPETVVDKMLQLGGVKAGEKVVVTATDDLRDGLVVNPTAR